MKVVKAIKYLFGYWKRKQRERIAAIAMQGLMMDPTDHGTEADVARKAVICADILIKELNK